MATPSTHFAFPTRLAASDHAKPPSRAQTPRMAERIAEFAWAATELGAIETWSGSFRTALELCLGSRICSCIYWGPHHRILYNDAYGSVLGNKHPWALGRTVEEAWPEILDVIGPLMRRTFETGETTGGDDFPIFVNRSGYVEEAYFSFSYSPILDENGIIEGVFATLPETSVRVIGERRLLSLQHLGADSREARYPEQTLKIAAAVLERNPRDIPFAALYMWREDDHAARLMATANIERGTPWSPPLIDFDGADAIANALRSACSAGYDLLELDAMRHPIPLGAWKVPARTLLVMAFMPYGDDAPKAAMIAGVSPHQGLDENHLAFFRMLGDQITWSLAQTHSHEQEDERVRELQQRARAAQEAERVRIARNLHDTLLQDVQGLRYLLEAGIARAKFGDASAVGLFENALKASVHAIEEGREILSLLRSTSTPTYDLGDLLATLGAEITAGSGIHFHMECSGPERPVRAVVRTEIHALCREAITNAVHHSRAAEIKLHLAFGEPFSVCVSDDGCGMDSEVARLGRTRHFGLQGMRERAATIGGMLAIHTGQGSGTSVVLTVAAGIAYETICAAH